MIYLKGEKSTKAGVRVKFYVGVTDKDWFDLLKVNGCYEVNFWKPGTSPFRALQPGGMFLFKLHSPHNFVVGGGFFASFSILPTFLAWQAFGIANGTTSLDQLNRRIEKYRGRNGISENPQIGCVILTDAFFFDQEEWIPIPSDWSPNIVQGKGYSTDTISGRYLYDAIQERLTARKARSMILGADDGKRYTEITAKHRLGQGAFRIAVTDAYQRRCAISGEKTLPVLQAAHIQPYAENGPHQVDNGLLLRSDLHTLFDDGYITIDRDYRVSVSQRLHDDYGNGRDYYKYHGQQLLILPDSTFSRPSPDFIDWHNNHVYLG